MKDCLAGSFFKSWVGEVLVHSFEEFVHRVGATEDRPLIDGEVMASPRVSGSLVEEGEHRVDLAHGLDIIDVLNEVATEGLIALLASVLPVRQVDLVVDTRVGLRSGLLSCRLAGSC